MTQEQEDRRLRVAGLASLAITLLFVAMVAIIVFMAVRRAGGL